MAQYLRAQWDPQSLIHSAFFKPISPYLQALSEYDKWPDLQGYQTYLQVAPKPIETLSGGNVQRTVLARELSGEVALLIAHNPCFGLDLNAVAEIRNKITEARNSGAAVLLISADLDEILELSDRILVMFEGQLVYETTCDGADVQTIGRYMAVQA